METYYTIVKIAPSPSADDSLSIGLLLRDHSGFRFLFSDNKKKAAKNLLYENGAVVDFLIKQIEQKIREINNELKRSSNELFGIPSLITSEYFSYLNNYSNGILQFSKPLLLNDQVSEEKFIKLFEILVDKLPIDNTKSVIRQEVKFIRTIEKKLISRVKDRVHTHVKIDSKNIQSMYYPFTMDCIGLNGDLVGAKSLPFTKSAQTLDTQISHYTNIITFLSISKNKKFENNHFFLIADEPADLNSPEHKIWVIIQKQILFKVINSEQSDIVAEVIEDTNAKKFLQV